MLWAHSGNISWRCFFISIQYIEKTGATIVVSPLVIDVLGMFKEYSLNILRTFRQHWGNVFCSKCEFLHYLLVISTRNIPNFFQKLSSREWYLGISWIVPWEHSENIKGTLFCHLGGSVLFYWKHNDLNIESMMILYWEHDNFILRA